MRPGRNDPCPCGSGKKYKRCCGALALARRDVDALVEAADALRARGRAREALPLYEQALELNPRSAEARNNLGNALFELGAWTEALGHYRRALELRPDDAQVHSNLGNALRQLGQLEEALTHSERAVALDPRQSVLHKNLALVLGALARRDEAAASYRRALALGPADIETLTQLGNLLRDLGERREALACYAQAVQLDPQRADGHCNLGNLLFELRRTSEAAESFRRALALRADYPQAHLGLAESLRVQGRPADAEASCRAALALDPDAAEALSFLGELQADRGRFAEAHELFARAIALDPTLVSAFCSLAAHRRMTRADTAWLEGTRTLLAKPLPLGHEIHLRYALGKYCDDVGEYDEAFGEYRHANELTMRHGAGYDRAKLTGRVDRLIERFDAAFIRRCQASASDSERPVLIIGMPRSGTSLTEQILASHPAVFGAGEIRFWDDAFTSLERAGPEADAGSLTVDLAREYLERLSARERDSSPSGGAVRVVDKMPANFLYAGLIHAALPRARLIHMRRHPLDTCLSIYFQNFYNVSPFANDLQSLAHYYREYVRITDHWRTVLPPSALLEVPYEGLIEDQEHWTRRMLDFLGLPWEPRCLEFHQTDRVVITASKWQVRQRINSASVGRWRHYERHLGPLRSLVSLAQPMRVASSLSSSSA
jgi:tetratricopeptide (TPR) repeat protein